MYEITPEKLEDEKEMLSKQDSLEIIEYIEQSIELLISLKMEDEDDHKNFGLSKSQGKGLSSIKGNPELELLKSSKLTLDKEDNGYS